MMQFISNLLHSINTWMPWFKEPDRIINIEDVEVENNVCSSDKNNIKVPKVIDPHKHGHSFDDAEWKLSNLRKEINKVQEDLSFKDYNSGDNSNLLPKHTIKALRNIGPYMCSTNAVAAEKKVEFIGVHDFPSIAFVGFHGGKKARIIEKETGHNLPRFVFAIKADKRTLPSVERAPGCHIYECGMAVVLNKKFIDAKKCDESLDVVSDKNDRLIWSRWFSAVDKKTGESRSLKVFHKYDERVVTKKPRHKGSNPAIIHIPSSGWQHMWVDGDRDEEKNAFALAWCLNAWMTREWHWNVVCKSRKNRVTFSVPQNEAKRFFRDRDVEINGKRRPIFHMVKTHYRHNANGTTSIVKGHHRGNQRFKWDGYDISIIAPGLNVPSLTKLNMEAGFYDDDDPVADDMMDLRDATKLIAEKYQ